MSKGKISGSAQARTWFVVMWDKALENMGIDVEWTDLDKMQGNLESAFADVTPNFFATICRAGKNVQAGHHVHVALTFDKPKRLNAVAKMLGNAHTEVMRGTKEEAADYIAKRGKYVEKDEVVLRSFGKESAITDNSGQRIDLVAIKQDILAGIINASNIHKVALERGCTAAQVDEIKRIYRQVLLANAPQGTRPVKVVYVEGCTGSGKTHGAYERYKDIFRVSVDDSNSFPFNEYMGQRVLLLDELRPGIFKPAYLFQILDKYPLTVNVKGGAFPALWNTIVITTACRLDDWFKDDSGLITQDNNRRQLRRRIHEHYECIVTERDETGNTIASEWRRIDDVQQKAETGAWKQAVITDVPFS